MTDYSELARRLMNKMVSHQKRKPFKDIGGLHGGAFMLNYIRDKKEVLPKDIGEAMGVSSARIASALNDLESKGYITREIDISDRRKIIVRPTQKGEEAAGEIMQKVLQKAEVMLKSLGEHDATEFVRIMGRLAEMEPLADC